ncbi:MAG: hypothetical protein D6812_05245 [Deltaproteobacteria bacterium]|nr:MAG: hypothetical protein D6812_05245 [Deltaproteobacteria bacterium]
MNQETFHDLMRKAFRHFSAGCRQGDWNEIVEAVACWEEILAHLPEDISASAGASEGRTLLQEMMETDPPPIEDLLVMAQEAQRAGEGERNALALRKAQEIYRLVLTLDWNHPVATKGVLAIQQALAEILPTHASSPASCTVVSTERSGTPDETMESVPVERPASSPLAKGSEGAPRADDAQSDARLRGGDDPAPAGEPSGGNRETRPVTPFPVEDLHDPPPLHELLKDAEERSQGRAPDALAELEAALAESAAQEEAPETIPLLYPPAPPPRKQAERVRPTGVKRRPPLRLPLVPILICLTIGGGGWLGWHYRIPLIRGFGHLLVETGTVMETAGKKHLAVVQEWIHRRLVLYEARRAMTELDGQPAVYKILELTGEILAKEPNDEEARKIRRELQRTLLDAARHAMAESNYAEAYDLLQDAQAVDPRDPELQRLLHELEL